MLINHYKTTSNGLDHLKRRNKVIILVILFALVAFVYSMIWIDYQERKKSERPSLNQIVDRRAASSPVAVRTLTPSGPRETYSLSRTSRVFTMPGIVCFVVRFSFGPDEGSLRSRQH